MKKEIARSRVTITFVLICLAQGCHGSERARDHPGVGENGGTEEAGTAGETGAAGSAGSGGALAAGRGLEGGNSAAAGDDAGAGGDSGISGSAVVGGSAGASGNAGNTNCASGLNDYEPGCESNPYLLFSAGCYQRCGEGGGGKCASGTCQLSSYNPCVCGSQESCCDACGSQIWLCRPAPTTCLNPGDIARVMVASNSRGMCSGECRYDLQFGAATTTECDPVTLKVCANGADSTCTRINSGVLTAVGQARSRELLSTWTAGGFDVSKTYGCPDCADGGASTVSIGREQVLSTQTYEYGNPPKELKDVDFFTQSLINALNRCIPNDYVNIKPADCTAKAP